MSCEECLKMTREERDDRIRAALSIGRSRATWNCATCGSLVSIEAVSKKPARKKKAAPKKKAKRRRKAR